MNTAFQPNAFQHNAFQIAITQTQFICDPGIELANTTIEVVMQATSIDVGVICHD
jgi:hypothetical protein